MQVESHRLTQLVKEIVDLSRLQVADTLQRAPASSTWPQAVHEAIDRSRLAAEAKGIEIAAACRRGDCSRSSATRTCW